MTPYEERLCRTCQYGKKSEYQKPCVVYWDDCQLYRPIEEMTTERAIEILKGAIKKPNSKDGYIGQALTMAIKALEQQPCDDAVSRQALIDKATSWDAHFADSERAVSLTDIMSLPSVTPKYTDEEIQKIQELEQAQLEKAYELGKTESFEDWLSTFNTESATECFTAVQELKKRLEGENDS